jgi:short-subunit dehydrogenase
MKNTDTVWITGASSGIGEALTLLLSKRGMRLIISSRNVSALEAVRQKCGANAGNMVVQPLDLGDQQSISDAVDKVLSTEQKIDCVFLNGGLSQRSLATETSLDIDRHLMEVNYFGTVGMAKKLLPFFIKQGHGHFVVTSSLAGIFGFPLRSSYSASKHALHGFFETLRAEQFQNHILVTMACPGRISTNISVNALGPDGKPTRLIDDAQKNGMPAIDCARKMIKAVERNKKEVYIGGVDVLMAYFRRFIPIIYYKLVTRVKPN